MAFRVEITTPDDVVEARILKAAARTLDVALRHAAGAIQLDVAALADALIRKTPEYASLLGGDLMGELGLADPGPRMEAVLRTVRDGVRAWSDPIRVVGNRIEGGLHIGLLRKDYEDLLGLAEASYVSQPSGSEIPWLGWMVGGGDRVIVFDYDVEPALTPAQRARSRSKRALMIRGKGWRMPPWASGSFEDNFLTRAFDVPGVEAELDRIVQFQLSRRLS